MFELFFVIIEKKYIIPFLKLQKTLTVQILIPIERIQNQGLKILKMRLKIPFYRNKGNNKKKPHYTLVKSQKDKILGGDTIQKDKNINIEVSNH